MEISNNFDVAVWWSIAKECEYATFFHTPLWHQLAAATYPDYKDETILIRFKNGKEAILPLLNVNANRMLFKQLRSTFAGCYGGLISSSVIEPNEQESVYLSFLPKQFTQLKINGNPIYNNNLPSIPGKTNSDFTHLILLENNFEDIFSNFSKGHRSSYKKGCKMGVTVRKAQDIEDYREYFGAYLDSLRRWGENASSDYPWQLFEKGFYLSQDYPDNIKLWVAEVDNKLIAGAWVFYWNQHVVWWHGAAYEEYFNYYPNNVLQTKIIQNAVAHGFRYYDFNPSGGHASVASFKGRFGAEKRPFTQIIISSPLIQFGKKIKRWVQ
jgi:hypothetical protein